MKRVFALTLTLVLGMSIATARPSRRHDPAASPLPGRAVSNDAFVDVRAGRLVTPRAEAVAAVAAARKSVADLRVTWNARTGTVKEIFSERGFLTPPSKRSPQTVARTWIAAHRALFGLSPAAELTLVRNATLPGTGLHPLIFRQRYGDIVTVAGGTVGVNVTRDGRIASAWGDTGVTGSLPATPRISAADALRAAARFERETIDVESLGQRPRGDRLAIFGGGVSHHNARLVAFPTATGPVLAWRVFYAKSATEMFVFVVDASDGAVLYRHNQTSFEAPEGLIYQNYPGAPHGGTQETYSFGPTPQSPDGWVGPPRVMGQAGPAVTTAGNNVIAFTDWTYPKLAGTSIPAAAAGAGIPSLTGLQSDPYPDSAPVSADGRFDYPFQDNWGHDCTPTDTPSTVADAPDPVGPVDAPAGYRIENPSFVKDRDPSVTNIFYFFNRIHDLSYALGFDEAMGNFQQKNFKTGGHELDAVRVMAMAGITGNQVNNAFFSTAPDGGEPTQFFDPAHPASIASYSTSFSGIFLTRPDFGWNAICGDLDFDASSVWHEYTHGITTRTVGDPNTADGLNAQQSGSMGEAWSDWFATHFLQDLGLEKRNVVGGWTEANLATGYRNYALDKNPLTYGDFGYSTRGPEVHADGEIWSATLWDLRTALIAKYGTAPGAERAGHIVYDALALSAPLPTFLTMRDDILNADKTRYGFADRDLIWSVFARRGMGVSARTADASDTHPTPGFDVPGGANLVVSGVVRDADGGTVAAKILVGLGEGAANPVTVSKPDGTFSIKMAWDSYPITIAAPGYGFQKQGRISVFPALTRPRGQKSAPAQQFNFTISKNLAAYGYGASVTAGLDDGDTGTALIDENERSRDDIPAESPVVIKLAGRGPATVRSVSLLPRSRSPIREIRDYRLDLSPDGRAWKTVLRGGVKAGVPFTTVAAMSRVSIALPHPVAARFARVTAVRTGGSSLAGLFEVGVFGTAPGMTPRAISTSTFDDHGTIALTNPSGDSSSVTLAAWQNSCRKPPSPVQGLDSYIAELPAGIGDGLHEMSMHNTGVATDIDVYFYGEDCVTPTGAIATGAAEEQGSIPAGTRWAQFVLYGGTTNGFDVHAQSSLQKVRGPTKPR